MEYLFEFIKNYKYELSLSVYIFIAAIVVLVLSSLFFGSSRRY